MPEPLSKYPRGFLDSVLQPEQSSRDAFQHMPTEGFWEREAVEVLGGKEVPSGFVGKAWVCFRCGQEVG